MVMKQIIPVGPTSRVTIEFLRSKVNGHEACLISRDEGRFRKTISNPNAVTDSQSRLSVYMRVTELTLKARLFYVRLPAIG